MHILCHRKSIMRTCTYTNLLINLIYRKNREASPWHIFYSSIFQSFSKIANDAGDSEAREICYMPNSDSP